MVFFVWPKKQFIFWSTLLIVAIFSELIPQAIFGGMLNALLDKKITFFVQLVVLYVIVRSLISIIRLTGKEKAGIIRAKSNQFIKIQGFRQIIRQSILWHQKQDTGSKIKKLEEGAEAAETFQRNLYQQYYNVLKNTIGVLIVFLFVSPLLSVVALIYLVIFLAIQNFYNKKTVALIDKIQQLKEIAYGKYTEALSNILTVKAQGQKFSKQEIQDAQAKLTQAKIDLLRFKNAKWKFFQVVNSVGLGGAYLYLGLNVLAGHLTIGALTALASYFNSFVSVIGQATVYYDDLLGIRQKVSRMLELFKEATEDTGTLPWPKEFKYLRLNDLDFRLGQFRLKKINLKITKGEHVVIVGDSGSGKSTLLKVLIGLYKVKPQMYTINEIPFSKIRLEERNTKIAIVLQDVELFNMSVKDNILLAKNYDEKLFNEVIEIAGLRELLDKLPKRENTLIGEKGYKLSGGERQRIGLARALYQQPEILILDEAFSNVQVRLAKKIIQRLKNKRLTIIQVTHSPNLQKLAERRVKLENGQIRV